MSLTETLTGNFLPFYCVRSLLVSSYTRGVSAGGERWRPPTDIRIRVLSVRGVGDSDDGHRRRSGVVEEESGVETSPVVSIKSPTVRATIHEVHAIQLPETESGGTWSVDRVTRSGGVEGTLTNGGNSVRVGGLTRKIRYSVLPVTGWTLGGSGSDNPRLGSGNDTDAPTEGTERVERSRRDEVDMTNGTRSFSCLCKDVVLETQATRGSYCGQGVLEGLDTEYQVKSRVTVESLSGETDEIHFSSEGGDLGG